MLDEFDSARLKAAFRDVMEEFFPPKSPAVDQYDVSDDDRDTDNIIPPYNSGDDPVSVKIVTDAPTIIVPRGALTWGGQATIVGAVPQLIVGKDKRRRTVIIKNLSTNAVALDTVPSVKFVTPPGFGSPILPGGDSITLDTCGDVWAIAASSSTGEGISIWQVFDAGL